MQLIFDIPGYFFLLFSGLLIVYVIMLLLRKSNKFSIKQSFVAKFTQVLYILFFVLILRAFIVEIYRIPSGSMKPQLLEGDQILVNKAAYQWKFPLLGFGLLKFASPKRGDIVVFTSATNEKDIVIKRVVGVPGDTLEYKNKILYINGQEIPTEFISNEIEQDSVSNRQMPVHKLTEDLVGVRHEIYLKDVPGMEQTKVIVPRGQLFVMGDNRDNSRDSRFWGFLPEDNVLGQAKFIFFSFEWKYKVVRWDRIGTVLN